MALGEAFVNVRADLKPFSKDLEKGLKVILAAAERRLAAEGQFGKHLGQTFGKNVGGEAGKGVEDEFQIAAKKGIKRGISDSAKFFAVLGDFVDDGLSAVPAEVKAAIIVGATAAAVVIAPLLAGVISASIIGGGVAGAAILGILLASRFRAITNQFQGLLQSVLQRLAGPASRFIDPLLRVAEKIDNMVAKLAPNIDHIFSQVAGALEPLTEGVLGFVEQVVKGLQVLVSNARPVIDVLARQLPELGDAIAAFFVIISSDSSDAALALSDFIHVISFLIIELAAWIQFLEETYFWLRVVAAAMSGDWQTASLLFQQRAIGNEDAATGFASALGDNLNPALNATAAEAKATALAISPLLTKLTKGMNASIDFAEAMDNLRDSIKNGNKDFRESTKQGRDNLRKVSEALNDLGIKRDEDIRKAIENGQATDKIEADYQRQVNAIEGVVSATGHETQALKDTFTEARKLPADVAINVRTPGLDDALAGFRHLGSVAFQAGAKAAAAIAAAGGHGLRTTPQYAMGGIVSSPTLAMIGEAGYSEAVIPDPAIMPRRAMQLSNEIGLTGLIADQLSASRQQVVNVYIGSQRLQEMIDYQLAFNNNAQALAWSQGTR